MTSRLPVYLSSAVTCMLVLLGTHASAQGRGAELRDAAQQLREAEAHREAAKRYADVLLEAQRQGGVQPGGRGGRGAPSSQTAAPLPSDPLAGPVVTSAPYSGDAVTTVTQTLGDGTRIEQRAEAKFFRDSAGRIRREQTILGLAALNPGAQAQTVVTIGPTSDGVPTLLNGQPTTFVYTLDPVARTARRVLSGNAITDWTAAAGNLVWNMRGGPYSTIPSPTGLRVATLETPPGAGRAEELGTRQIEGVKATGRKTTSTIPAGQIGNDRPIEITDERWESPDLRVLVYSRYSDPRSGVVEYRLVNINRAEPPPDLFVVPPDYTILEPGRGGAGGRGVRQGGPAPQNPPGSASPRGDDPRR